MLPRCFVVLYIRLLGISVLGMPAVKEAKEHLNKDLYTTLTTLLQEKKKIIHVSLNERRSALRDMRKGSIINSFLWPLKNCFLSAFLTTFRNKSSDFHVLFCASPWFLLADCSIPVTVVPMVNAALRSEWHAMKPGS